jgi:anti-anti-sigma factor
MKTKIEEQENTFLVCLEGEMDTAAAMEAEKILQPLYKTRGRDVIIDCEGLEYIASSGLRILLSILKGANKLWGLYSKGVKPTKSTKSETIKTEENG